MNTEQLIRQLAEDAAPVRALRPPLIRLGQWLLLAVPMVLMMTAMMVWAMGVRPDFADMWAQPRYRYELAITVLTAVSAAYAALVSGIPGRSLRPLLLPMAAVVLWLGGLAVDCVVSWQRDGYLVFHNDWVCLPAIAMVGFGPAALMVALTRRAAPLRPRLTIALTTLAATAMADVTLRIVHQHDTGLMLLVWQLGSVLLLTMLTSWFGRHLLAWRHLHKLYGTQL